MALPRPVRWFIYSLGAVWLLLVTAWAGSYVLMATLRARDEVRARSADATDATDAPLYTTETMATDTMMTDTAATDTTASGKTYYDDQGNPVPNVDPLDAYERARAATP